MTLNKKVKKSLQIFCYSDKAISGMVAAGSWRDIGFLAEQQKKQEINSFPKGVQFD